MAQRRQRMVGGVVLVLGLVGCEALRNLAVDLYDSPYEAQDVGTAQAGVGPVAVFDGADAKRPRLNVRLVAVAEGLQQPTDIQFPPGDDAHMVVVEKGGRAVVLTRQADDTFGDPQELARLPVLVRSEEGLLGLAFHPDFAQNGRLFLNHVSETGGGEYTMVTEWVVKDPAVLPWSAAPGRLVLQERQPYPNHNAGQLAFGPDGMLYVGFGDGGFRADPHGHGQDSQTWLGAMLRLDIDHPAPDQGYAVPADNPFVGSATHRPEIWATGLRNPWRYSFDPQGRLIVADVGQDAWEEVDIVSAGDNLGWAIREGRHCFPPEVQDCARAGMVDPVYEYSHESGDGNSITGGVVVTAADAGALQGKYVFGDFVSGRLWALELPATATGTATVSALGRWGILAATFGRDASGHAYVADFASGKVFRIEG